MPAEALDAEVTALLPSGDDGQAELSTKQLLDRLWPPALALFSSAATAVLVFPFFTFVPSCGRLGGMLPQVHTMTKTCTLPDTVTARINVHVGDAIPPWALEWV